jgi:transposase InsO family protein
VSESESSLSNRDRSSGDDDAAQPVRRGPVKRRQCRVAKVSILNSRLVKPKIEQRRAWMQTAKGNKEEPITHTLRLPPWYHPELDEHSHLDSVPVRPVPEPWEGQQPTTVQWITKVLQYHHYKVCHRTRGAPPTSTKEPQDDSDWEEDFKQAVATGWSSDVKDGEDDSHRPVVYSSHNLMDDQLYLEFVKVLLERDHLDELANTHPVLHKIIRRHVEEHGRYHLFWAHVDVHTEETPLVKHLRLLPMLYRVQAGCHRQQVKDEDCRRCVPLSQVAQLLDSIHSGGCHLKDSYTTLSQQYLGVPRKAVRLAAAKCQVCNVTDPRQRNQRPPRAIAVSDVRQRYTLDLIDMQQWKHGSTGLGAKKRYIAHLIDHSSKYRWAEAISEKLGTVLVEMVRRVFQDWGHPAVLHTDNGTEFANKDMEAECRSWGTYIIHGRPYHPQSQGVIENANGALKRAMVKFKASSTQEKRHDWTWVLSQVLWQQNEQVHSTTGMSPREHFQRYNNFSRQPRPIPRGEAVVIHVQQLATIPALSWVKPYEVSDSLDQSVEQWSQELSDSESEEPIATTTVTTTAVLVTDPVPAVPAITVAAAIKESDMVTTEPLFAPDKSKDDTDSEGDLSPEEQETDAEPLALLCAATAVHTVDTPAVVASQQQQSKNPTVPALIPPPSKVIQKKARLVRACTAAAPTLPRSKARASGLKPPPRLFQPDKQQVQQRDTQGMSILNPGHTSRFWEKEWSRDLVPQIEHMLRRSGTIADGNCGPATAWGLLHGRTSTPEQASSLREEVLEWSNTTAGQSYYSRHASQEMNQPPWPLVEVQAEWEQDRVWVSPEFFTCFGGMHEFNVFLLMRSASMDGTTHTGIKLITNGGTLVKEDRTNMCCVYFQVQRLNGRLGHFEVVEDSNGKRLWDADDPVLTDCLWPAMIKAKTSRSIRDSRRKMLVAAANRIDRANQSFQVGDCAWLTIPEEVVKATQQALNNKAEREAARDGKLLVKVIRIDSHAADGELAPLPSQMFLVATELGLVESCYPIDMLKLCDPPPEPTMYPVVGMTVDALIACKSKPMKLVQAFKRYVHFVNTRKSIAAQAPAPARPAVYILPSASESSPSSWSDPPASESAPPRAVTVLDVSGNDVPNDDVLMPCRLCKETLPSSRYIYCMYPLCATPMHRQADGCRREDRMVVVDEKLVYCSQSCARQDRGMTLPPESLSQPAPALLAQSRKTIDDGAIGFPQSQPVSARSPAKVRQDTVTVTVCVSCLKPQKRGQLLTGCDSCRGWHHRVLRGMEGCTREGWNKGGSCIVAGMIQCVGCRYKDDEEWRLFVRQQQQEVGGGE